MGNEKNMYCDHGENCDRCAGPVEHVDFKIEGQLWHLCEQGIITGPGCGGPHIFEIGGGFGCICNGEFFEIKEETGELIVAQRRIIQTSLESCSGDCPHIEEAIRKGYPINKRAAIDGIFDSLETINRERPRLERAGLIKPRK